MTPILTAKAHDGLLIPVNPADWKAHVWSLDGHTVEVIIRRVREQRSLQANRYYWGVVIETIRQEWGWDRDDLHDALAMKFLRLDDDAFTGLMRRKSTRDLTSDEFAAYVDDCIRFVAEHGIVVPAPDEVQP